MNSYNLRWLLYTFIILILITVPIMASNQYVITNSIEDFQIQEESGYTVIKSPECVIKPHQVGYPDLPVVTKRYYIPTDRRVIGIRIIDLKKEPVPGHFTVYPKQEEMIPGVEYKFTGPAENIYGSNKAYPEENVVFGGTSFKRDHQIATITAFPFEYFPASGELYFYSYIEFEFILSNNLEDIPYKRLDIQTLKHISGIVENTEEIPAQFGNSAATLKTGVTESIDFIPCVIVTNLQMQSVFDEYAWWKTKTGDRTEVFRVDMIELMYPCDSADNANGICTQGSIRKFIQAYHENYYTDYVILAGDVDIIPPLHVNSRDRVVMTDLYYSNLQGNWNDDGDEFFGECDWKGDTVDYTAEVYVGRLPCNTVDEAQDIVDKLMSYQTNNSVIGYQSKALFISSNLFRDGDGEYFINKLMAKIPQDFTITARDSAEATTVLADMASGYGLMVNYSHAQGPHDFITRYHIPWGPGTYEFIYYYDFDTVQTNSQYSVFLNGTCHNNNLADTVNEAVSRHFMTSENGGGVAYIGSTDRDYARNYYPMHTQLLEILFDNIEPMLCPAMIMAKEANWIPSVGHTDGVDRFGLFTYNYLGDPMLEMWTDEPKEIYPTLPYVPHTIYADSLYDTIKVYVGYNVADEIPDAKVCLTKGYDGVYEIEYTHENGYAYFTDIIFPSSGAATLVATKRNHFPREDTIQVLDGGGSCPMLYVNNGIDYEFTNNILAQSEDLELSEFNNVDYYPIYGAPLLDDNTIRFRIREDEKEKSYFDQFSMRYIYYPINQRVTYTNNNEFRFVSDNFLEPINVEDQDGNDLLATFLAESVSYESAQPGYIIATYQLPGGSPKIADEPGGGIDPPPGGKNNPKLFADEPGVNPDKNVVISIQDGNGDWQEINTLYPRINNTSYLIELGDYYINNELTVKVDWGSNISINSLPYLFLEGDPIQQLDAPVMSVTHSKYGDVASEVLLPDNSEITLNPGEYIDLVYGTIPYQKDHRIATVFKSFGRYKKIKTTEGGLGGFSFEQNYPNPFNPATTFSFSLPVSTNVSLTIYNILGRRVASIVDKEMPAGKHEVTWNGTDENGNPTASGIYFAKFKAGEFASTKKLSIVK